MTSAPPRSPAAAAARELRAAPWTYFSPLLIAATGAVLLTTSAASWLALFMLLGGAVLFLVGLTSVLTDAYGWRGPQEWQRMRGTHPDQYRSSEV